MQNGRWWSYIEHDEKEDRPIITMPLLRRVGSYALPYRGRIFATVAIIIGSTLLSLLPPLLFRELIDHALPEHNEAQLNWLALGMVLVPSISGIFSLLQSWLVAQVGGGIVSDLRTELFAHLQLMPMRFFTNTRIGEILSRLNNDVMGAQGAISGTLLNIVSNSVSLVGTLTIMISLEWRLTVLAVLVLPFFVIPGRRIGRILRSIVRRQMTLNADMYALMSETLNISGALLVKLFGRAGDENERMKERSHAVRDMSIRQAVVLSGFFLSLNLASAVGIATVFWIGGRLVLNSAFTVGTIVAFTAYLGQLYAPLIAFTRLRVEFTTSLVSFERVFEVLDYTVETHQRTGAPPLDHVHGAVRFDSVSFTYDNHNLGDPAVPVLSNTPNDHQPQYDGAPAQRTTRYALRDVSFDVQPGQVVALVGHSGAGKTTITYLLPRLYDVTEGSIQIDGRDVRDMPLDSLRSSIGLVTQETYLFHDSIRSNLLFARPTATEAELYAACENANIHDFILSLPGGYDTVVGERGYRLSGGEKQRLSLARVILKDPRILILDEATSNLDSQTEALIQQAFERVMLGRTSIVIAHRLSTILSADIILVIEQGRLVEQGTHAELLKKAGVYAGLYHTQFAGSKARQRCSLKRVTVGARKYALSS